MLPQVLAGLGALSAFAAGCLFWLERLQPLFAMLAVSALSYEAWLVARRPPHRRTKAMLWIFWTSLGSTTFVFLVWSALWLRYR